MKSSSRVFSVFVLYLFCPLVGIAEDLSRGTPVDLTSLFTNDGIAQNNSPGDGNLDGYGYALPAEHFPVPGLNIVGGVQFLIPGHPSGQKNNVVSGGQLIPIEPGNYHTAVILVASTNGASTAEITLHYDDGTRRPFSFYVADWYRDPVGTLVFPFRYAPDGSVDRHPVFIDAVRIAVDGRRRLTGMTLPSAPQNERRLHIFALTMHKVEPQVALSLFDFQGTPQVASQRGTHRVARVFVQNLGSKWLDSTNKARASVHATGIRTGASAPLDALGPGETRALEIEFESNLPRGSEITAEVRVFLRNGRSNSLNVRLVIDPATYTTDVSTLAHHPSVPWFDDAKFGIFMHWGLYSIPAWSPPATFFAEWYWQLMTAVGSPTFQHHARTYGTGFGYDDFIPQFTAAGFDATEWVNVIANSQARYFVFTAKHHDGLALYDSNSTGRDTVDLGPRRDFVRELFRAVQQREPALKRGIYYSLYEWFHPAFSGTGPVNPYSGAPVQYTGATEVQDYVHHHALAQIRELIDVYDPDMLWGDGHASKGADYWQTKGVLAHYYNQARDRQTPKDVVINDRWAAVDPVRSRLAADFATSEYETFRATNTHKWEMTRGLDPHSFGYNAQTPDDLYFSADEAIDLLVDVVSKNGNLLLNIGPSGDGSIPTVMRRTLIEIGNWLRVNREAVFDTAFWWRGSEEGDLRFIVGRDDAFYVIALKWPESNRLVIESWVPIRVRDRVRMLGYSDQDLQWRLEDKRLVIDLPPNARHSNPYAWAIRIGAS